jgi:hypothetical protein
MERGEEMKITVVGALTVVAIVVLLGLLAYQVAAEIEKNRRNNNEQPNGSY